MIEEINTITITLSYYRHNLPWPAKFSIFGLQSALQEISEDTNAITITLCY
jgi:hypothetical protein